jgi:hypothetical protein
MFFAWVSDKKSAFLMQADPGYAYYCGGGVSLLSRAGNCSSSGEKLGSVTGLHIGSLDC